MPFSLLNTPAVFQTLVNDMYPRLFLKHGETHPTNETGKRLLENKCFKLRSVNYMLTMQTVS